MPENDATTPNPLHFAAHDGDLAAVKRLVEEGTDVNTFDEIGFTPLHYAAEADRLDVAAYLLEHGADVNARHEPTIGNTPLGGVAGDRSIAMARLFVEAGADPTIRGWMGLNALDRAKARKRGDGPDVYSLLVETSRSRSTAS